MSVVLVTGGFDPLHSGHIEIFNKAKELGDILFVGVNSDAWLERKKGRAFLPIEERLNVVNNIKSVGHAFEFDDSDGSALKAIDYVRALYPSKQIIFANGGDRTASNIPELNHTDNNLVFKFGVGGENKMNSSSTILEEWKYPKTERAWGYYRVLFEIPGTKVKELTVQPHKELSMQRHKNRAEYWHVTEGTAHVIQDDSMTIIPKDCGHTIDTNEWHQLINPYNSPCRIIEIQYGDECVESDIERKE